MARHVVSAVHLAIAFALTGITAQSVAAQTGVVRGIVVDAVTHARIPFAVVRVAGTNLSDTTAADGGFEIAGVPAGERAIEAERSGFIPASSGCRRIAASDTARLAIPLAAVGSDTTTVAPGYVRLSSITGKVAGLEVRSSGGHTWLSLRDPDSPVIQNPAYVVDGMVFPAGHYPNRALSLISDRIERVDVDRSASAIAASGVCSATAVITVRMRPSGR